MAVVASGELAVTPDLKGFESRMSSSIGSLAKKAAVAFGGAFAATKAVDFLTSSIADARESNKIAAQTAAAIKSTGGAANISAKQVDELANSISRKTGIDDEQIAKASNLLLTFTNLKNRVGEGNDIFNQATKIAVDMGAALGTDAAGSAIQLGKALNDPIKGIAALTRVGVTFSDAQKKQIENFVKAGKVADAQKVILQELTKEFGGSAEAQATASDKLKVTLGNLKEDIGNKFIPIIDKVATFLAEKLPGALDAAGAAWGRLQTLIAPVRDYVVDTLFPALQDAANTILPKIQDAVRQVGDAFENNKPQIEELGGAIKTITPYLVDIARIIETVVIQQVAALASAFIGLAGFAVKAWDGIVDVIRGAVNKIIDAINFLIKAYNRLPFGKDIDPLKHVTFGQGSKSAADLNFSGAQGGVNGPQFFARGGIVQGPFGSPQLAVVHAGEEVLTPAQRRDRNISVYVNMYGQTSEAEAYAAGRAAGRGIEDEMARTDLRRAARAR